MPVNHRQPATRGTQMRKGTHSCSECRRRKARCIFRPEISSVCMECFTRGTSCQSQRASETTKSDKSTDLVRRVVGLRNEPARIPQAGVSHPVPYIPESLEFSPSAVPDDLDSISLSTGNHEHAPLVTMIEKTISGLCPNSGLSCRNASSRPQNSKKTLMDFKISRSLRALFPSSNDLDLILGGTSKWWSSWRCLYSVTSEAKSHKSLSDFISWGRGQRDPVFIALALLCVVMSIQQTYPGTYDHKLIDPIPLRELMDECLSAVDCQIVANSEYSGSCQGIEVTTFLAQCHINLGQPQKAWLLFRRAISLAQLLGLNRSGDMKPSYSNTPVEERRQSWWALNALDRFLSLVLGLPSAVADDTDGFHTSINSSAMDVISYHRQLSLLAGQIMKRNKGCPDPSLSWTHEIDLELDGLDLRLPPELQSCTPASTSAETYERLMTRFWHYQLKVFLHLPFALRSHIHPQFQHNHDACFSASGEMLRLYHIMRLDSRNAYHMCRIIDFQAFTAALLLILGCLGYGGKPTMFEAAHLRLLDTTVEILHNASTEYGGMVASQSAQVLSRLRATFNNPATINNSLNSEKIAVPYFGTITLSSNRGQQAQDSLQPIQPASSENNLADLPSNGNFEMGFGTDFPHIDIDWDAIINMDLDQEWNWLSEISEM